MVIPLYYPATEVPGHIRLGGKIVGSFTVDSEKNVHVLLDENIQWSTLDHLIAHASWANLSVCFDLKRNHGSSDKKDVEKHLPSRS